MTNATKAIIGALVNNVLALLIAFGVDLSDEQTAAILGLTNTVLLLIVALTYKNSPKRVD